jgi:hypothetical protein
MRVFDLQTSTNVALGGWQPVPGCTNIVGNNQLVTVTNSSLGTAFFRVKVSLH